MGSAGIGTSARTGGAVTLTTADIADSADKRYVTDAMLAGLVPPVVRTIMGTTDTLVLADAFQSVKATDESPTTITVPPHSDIAFAAFDQVSVFAGGTGELVLSPGSGVTLQSAGVTVATLTLPAGQGATLIQTDTLDIWDIVSDTEPPPTAQTYTPATGAQTVTLLCTGKNHHEIAGHASGTAITVAFSGDTSNQMIRLTIRQGAVASTLAGFSGATVTWITSGGTAPSMPTANKVITLVLVRTGTGTWDAYLAGVSS